MTQGFVPRFPPPEGNKPHHLPHHRAGVSTGGRLVLLLPKSAGIAKEIAMAWRDACENYNIYIYGYICRQFGTILDALEDNSFMIFYAHSGMNERNSSLEVFLRIWHNLTVKHRDLKEKNCRLQKRDTETQLMNPQFDAIGPPVITCDPKTWLWHAWTTSLRMLRWFATGGWLFPKGRSQWVTRVISTSGDSHMSHLHFWFTCSCLHFALDVVPNPVSPPPQICSLC